MPQIPGAQRGFENPRGPGAMPEGIFKSPMGEGDLGKIHETKSEFCIYFFVNKSKNSQMVVN